MSPLDTTSAPFHQLFAGETAAYTPAFIRRTSNLSGIAAMLAATGSFVVCDSFMKLATADLPPFEVLFLRGVAASLACGLLVVLPGDGRAISSALHLRPLLRAAAETLSVLCYIVALSRLPIADVIALLQTAPLILILAVALLLGERVGTARVGLALGGFAGAFLSPSPEPPESRRRPCWLSRRPYWARRVISSGAACRRAFQ
jgi:drug/metabolite transporter (DMT)-like permease